MKYETSRTVYGTVARVLELIEHDDAVAILKARQALGPVFPHDILFSGADTYQIVREQLFFGPAQDRAARAWCVGVCDELRKQYPERRYYAAPRKLLIGY